MFYSISCPVCFLYSTHNNVNEGKFPFLPEYKFMSRDFCPFDALYLAKMSDKMNSSSHPNIFINWINEWNARGQWN